MLYANTSSGNSFIHNYIKLKKTNYISYRSLAHMEKELLLFLIHCDVIGLENTFYSEMIRQFLF